MSNVTPAITGRRLTMLGRHRIIAKLGRGGMADVYLTVVQGQHGVTKLLVAKVVREELSRDPDYRTRFVKEARIATLMNHRNLVQSFEVDEADGLQYLTMEYLDGQPLHQVIGTIGADAMPLGVHVGILASALAGLHAAHEQKDLSGHSLDLVHRDVSPQNIFVTYDGEVKVVDFGVAKARGGVTVTETGALVGKLGYMAPEQALATPIDRRADVFAVGIMLWEALARRRFVDKDDGEANTLRKRINGELPSPRTVAPDAPEELVAICERAIAFDPDARYPTAAEFEEALTRYLDMQGTRVGAKDIAALIGPRFETERASVRALIEEQLTALGREEPASAVGTELDLTSLTETNTVATAAVPRPRRAPLAGMVILGLVFVALVSGLALKRTPAPVLPAQAVPLPSVSSPAGAAPTAVVASAAPDDAKPTVRVRIHVTPTSAALRLDGKTLEANPFAGMLPRDGESHVLSATAPGYGAATHEVRLDNDVDVDLTLVPVGPKAQSAPPRLSAKPRGAADPAQPQPLRPVDDKDPYAQ